VAEFIENCRVMQVIATFNALPHQSIAKSLNIFSNQDMSLKHQNTALQ